MLKVWGYVRRILKWPGMGLRLGALLSLSVAVAFLEGIGVGFLIPVLENLQGAGGASPFSRAVAGLFGFLGLPFTLPFLLAGGLAIHYGHTGLDYFRRMLTARWQNNFLVDIQARIFRNLMDFDLAFFHRNRIGALSNVMLKETPRVVYSLQLLIEMGATVTLLAIYVAVQWLVSWKVTLLTLPVLLLVGFLLRPRRTYQMGVDQSRENDNMQSIAVESLSGIREIKVLGLGELSRRRFGDTIRAWADLETALTRTNARFTMTYRTMIFTVFTGLVYCGSRWGGLSLPALLIFLVVLQKMAPQVESFVSRRHWWLGSLSAFERVNALIEKTEKEKSAVASGAAPFAGFDRSLEFSGVSFQYASRERPALSKVSFAIAKGKTTAIVGSSGAGKSTVLDLLARFHDPAEGSLLSDGRDVREFDLANWRGALGFVSQENFLFNDTLENNIRFGKQDASPEEVRGAARQAHAADFISELPQGYGTRVGDRGVALSGGQRQRIALARTLLRRPRVLLLDEATSDLDAKSEAQIRRAIRELSGQCTIVMVAHRLAMVEEADRIVVLHEGRLAEAGTHRELLALNGRYAGLHRLQTRGETV